MCIFTHIAAGAFVGAFSPSPYASPFLGLASHVALDVIPHYDFENMKTEIFFGVLVVTILVLGGANSSAILLGAAFAVLPDLENLLWKLGKIKEKQKIFPGHVGIIPHGKVAGAANLLIQFAVTAAFVIYLVRRGA